MVTVGLEKNTLSPKPGKLFRISKSVEFISENDQGAICSFDSESVITRLFLGSVLNTDDGSLLQVERPGTRRENNI